MFSSGLGRLRLLCGHSHPDLQHPAVVHTGDGDVQALRLEPVPCLGQAAQLVDDPAGDPLMENRSYRSVRSAPADTRKLPSACLRKDSTTSSCSSQISPTSSSRMSSMVSRPSVPPYSSTTMAIWVFFFCSVRRSAPSSALAVV